MDEEIKEIPKKCSLFPKTGPCKARLERFYFNRQLGKCEVFIYGGCKGNANNFKRVEDCMKECSISEMPNAYANEIDICKLKADSGPCEALTVRFFFNSTSKKCEEFNYGGCKGICGFYLFQY